MLPSAPPGFFLLVIPLCLLRVSLSLVVVFCCFVLLLRWYVLFVMRRIVSSAGSFLSLIKSFALPVFMRVGSDAADTLRESTGALSQLFDSVCVTDIWRYLHPDASAFTWTRWNGSISSRIDMVGVPLSWVPSVTGAFICPCPFSDHCAVTVSVCVPDVVPPGPGL